MTKNGFTFIELLLVLLITSILTLIGTNLSFATLHKQYEKQFFSTLTEDLRYIQNISISDEQADARIFFDSTFYKITTNQSSSPSLTKSLPKGWKINDGTFKNIIFNSNGTLRHSGTIHIRTPQADFKVVFPLGKGSYYVSKI